jgi:hypothetical protein
MSSIPCLSVTGSIEEITSICEKIRAIVRVSVVIEAEDMFVGKELLPRISFVAGLPDGIICKADKNCLIGRK